MKGKRLRVAQENARRLSEISEKFAPPPTTPSSTSPAEQGRGFAISETRNESVGYVSSADPSEDRRSGTTDGADFEIVHDVPGLGSKVLISGADTPVASSRQSDDDLSPERRETASAPVAPEAPVARGAHPVQEKYPEQDSLILVIPDLHAPNHDPMALEAVLGLMEAQKFAEVILLGDAVECVSCSWFGGPESLRAWKEEARQAAVALMAIRMRHDGPITLLEGNHDVRPELKVERVAPQLCGSIQEQVGYANMGIAVIPEREQPVRRGRCLMLHGHTDLPSKSPPVYHARRLCDVYSQPLVSVLYGHTHRAQTFTRAIYLEGSTWSTSTAYGLGCMEKRPKWLKGVLGWCQECAVVHPESGTVQVLRINDGALWFGGRRFGAVP